MAENEKILCSDGGCRYNSGGGYYGLCKHPSLDQPHYTGGIDRLYRSSCKAREPKRAVCVVMGGQPGAEKEAMMKALAKAFGEAKDDRIKTD